MQVTRIHDVHCALPLGDADEPDELAGARGADREHQDGAARRVHGRPPLPPSHDDHEWGAGPSTRVGKLVLVDLAGYERFALTGITTGIAAEEAKKINASLLAKQPRRLRQTDAVSRRIFLGVPAPVSESSRLQRSPLTISNPVSTAG